MTFASVNRRVAMLAVVGLLPAFSAGQAGQHMAMEREAVQLVRQLEEVGRDVRYHAGRLNALAGSTLISRWTHIHHLDQIKVMVNEGLRPTLTRLTEIQPQLPGWKQESVDRMLAAASALAADATEAILTKSEVTSVPPAMNAEYRRVIGSMYDHAEALVKTSDVAGTYAAARLKAAEAGLKVPQS